MNKKNLIVKAPGKLMIAGEYAVTTLDKKAVVIAVDKYITVEIENASKNSISIEDMKLRNITWELKDEDIEFNIEDKKLEFIKNSLSTSIKFLKEKNIKIKKFKLQVESELKDPLTNKKYGLGSSAAIIVSVISAILSFHGLNKEKCSLDKIFKLSLIAHIKTQKNGSGADIAAATYGGWIEYSTFDNNWLLKELNSSKILDIISKPWPNLGINRLMPIQNLKLAIGWTNSPAKTGPMIKKFQDFSNENPKAYNNFLKESSTSVDKLIHSFNRNNHEKLIDSIRKNRKVLQQLSYDAKMNIETDKLRELCDIAEKFGSGKSSGAGGGDCGIAFIESEEQRKELYKLWERSGITPLDLNVSNIGVSIQKI